MKRATLWLALCTSIGGCQASARIDRGSTWAGSISEGNIAVSPTIDVERMLSVVRDLSDDAMAGRDSRTADSILAAARYLARVHESVGTQSVGESFLVDFPLVVDRRPGDDHHVWVDHHGDSTELAATSFVSLHHGDGRPRVGTAAFLGYAREPELDRLDLSQRIAVVLWGAPSSTTFVASELRTRLDALAKRHPLGIVFVAPTEALPAKASMNAVFEGLEMPIIVAKPDALEPLLPFEGGLSTLRGRLDGGDPSASHVLGNTTISLASALEDVTVRVPNVIGYISGSDLADEVVVLGAHYDHIGVEPGIGCQDRARVDDPEDGICNGADDNASGTAMLLELARALAEAHVRPRRTIVFAHFAGEELGLFGSEALAEHAPQAPPFAGARVVAMLNLDMVGRYRAELGVTIGSVSSSDAWVPLLESLDPRGLVLHFDRSTSSRSDHASFHRRNVPVLFFFTGLHPDYHRTSDEFESINQVGMAAIAKFVLDVALRLADGYALPFRPPSGPDEGETARLPGSTEP